MTVLIITSNDLLVLVILITPCKAAVSEFDQVWGGGRTGVGAFLPRQAPFAEMKSASAFKARGQLEPETRGGGGALSSLCLPSGPWRIPSPLSGDSLEVFEERQARLKARGRCLQSCLPPSAGPLPFPIPGRALKFPRCASFQSPNPAALELARGPAPSLGIESPTAKISEKYCKLHPPSPGHWLLCP